MLTSMRKGAGSWVAKGLMLLLVLSFGLWGIADYTGLYRPPDAATVGDVTITQRELSETVRREIGRLQQQLGGAFDAEAARRLGMADSALQNLVDQALILQEVQRLGLRAPDEAVRQAIYGAPAFRNAAGQFDRAAFENFLRSQGMSEAMLVQDLRRDLLRDQFIGSLALGLDGAPKAVTEALYRYRQERRVAEFVVFRDADQPAPPPPDEAALQQFHKDNAALFSAPEYRELKWVVLDPRTLADESAVRAADIEEEYRARAAEFQQPERRVIEQAVYPTEGAAKEARGLLADGLSFAAMAERTLRLRASDLSLGAVTRDELPAAIGAAAFSLPAGQVSEPVRSPLGWHLFRVAEIQPPSTKSLADATPEIRKYLAERAAADALIRQQQQVDDKLASGASIDEAARDLGLTAGAATVDAQGLNEQGQPGSIPGSPRFLQVAFGAEERNDPFAEELGDGSLFFVRVERIVPPALRPFEAVREGVAREYERAKRAEAAAAAAAAAQDRIKGGADFTAAGAVQVTPPTGRAGDGADRAFARTAVAQLFAAKPNETFTVRNATNDATLLVRVARVETPDPAAAEAARLEQIGANYGFAVGNDAVGAVRNALEQRFGVTINRQVVEGAY